MVANLSFFFPGTNTDSSGDPSDSSKTHRKSFKTAHGLLTQIIKNFGQDSAISLKMKPAAIEIQSMLDKTKTTGEKPKLDLIGEFSSMFSELQNSYNQVKVLLVKGLEPAFDETLEKDLETAAKQLKNNKKLLQLKAKMEAEYSKVKAEVVRLERKISADQAQPAPLKENETQLLGRLGDPLLSGVVKDVLEKRAKKEEQRKQNYEQLTATWNKAYLQAIQLEYLISETNILTTAVPKTTPLIKRGQEFKKEADDLIKESAALNVETISKQFDTQSFIFKTGEAQQKSEVEKINAVAQKLNGLSRDLLEKFEREVVFDLKDQITAALTSLDKQIEKLSKKQAEQAPDSAKEILLESENMKQAHLKELLSFRSRLLEQWISFCLNLEEAKGSLTLLDVRLLQGEMLQTYLGFQDISSRCRKTRKGESNIETHKKTCDDAKIQFELLARTIPSEEKGGLLKRYQDALKFLEEKKKPLSIDYNVSPAKGDESLIKDRLSQHHQKWLLVIEKNIEQLKADKNTLQNACNTAVQQLNLIINTLNAHRDNTSVHSNFTAAYGNQTIGKFNNSLTYALSSFVGGRKSEDTRSEVVSPFENR